MSIEGMWAVYFDDVVGGDHLNSGIVIFETLRLFGGDSMIAYLGSYEASGTKIKANFKTWAYNPTIVVTSAFGEVGPAPKQNTLEAALGDEGEVLKGHVWQNDNPDVKLGIHMQKISDLP